jgi:hypothetical protein
MLRKGTENQEKNSKKLRKPPEKWRNRETENGAWEKELYTKWM